MAIVFGAGLGAGWCFPVEGQTVRSDGAPASLRAILADAAKRSGADKGSVQIIRTEPAEWPDSGLGCPRAGQFYSQVLTPGWLVEVRSSGNTFEYHTDTAENFVLCAQR